MGVDQLDFPLAQPQELSATSGRILQSFHTACGEREKEMVKNQLIHGFYFILIFLICLWLDAERGIGKTQLQTKMRTQGHFQTIFAAILLQGVVFF